MLDQAGRVAAKKAVAAPLTVTTARAPGASSKSGEQRARRKIPAVTLVAAWIRAETGVGPSLASGSQAWRPSWADLPTEPTKSRRQARGRTSSSQERKATVSPRAVGARAKSAE